jgi:RTX calcium-binding nonapeptide repeat (4 copies)
MSIRRILSGAGGGLAVVGLAAVAVACTPTTVQAVVADGTLTVAGTDNADAITLRLKAGAPGTLQVDAGDDGTAEFEFDRGRFDKIRVVANGGNDLIRVDQVNGAFADEAATLDGGDGDDIIQGGDGADTLLGGAGRDSIDGNKGADKADLGADDDSFRWDPGDASDVIEGRDGSDTLVFNGADVDEVFTLDADGHRAIFTRNVGNVRMDMDGVETLNLAMLRGFDNFNADDFLGNTAMRKANVDMSAPAGGPDAESDSVNLIDTSAGHITATATVGRIDVRGTALATSITGSKIPDSLQIGAEGADIDIDPAVDALITTLINVHV